MESKEKSESNLIEDRLHEIFSKDIIEEQDIRRSKMWLDRWKQLNGWEEDQSQVIVGINNQNALLIKLDSEKY